MVRPDTKFMMLTRLKIIFRKKTKVAEKLDRREMRKREMVTLTCPKPNKHDTANEREMGTTDSRNSISVISCFFIFDDIR